MSDYQPHGVIPAVLLPFTDDLEIDEPAFRAHLRQVLDTHGISAITVNAHSTEVGSCSRDEQHRVLSIAVEEAAGTPVVSGVFTDSTREAQDIARQAQEDGAASLLVFPPALFANGAHVKPDMMIEHHRAIADATDLPLIFFQFPENEGLGFTVDQLERLCDEVPSVRATKDFSNSPVKLEATVRALQSRENPVNVLTTHSAWLLPSLVLGCAGILSGSGSVIADLHVALFDAVQRNDLEDARQIAARIYPLSSVFYADPFVDMHNRMKQALVSLGRLPGSRVRPPLTPLSRSEIECIEQALELSIVGAP